MTTSTLSKELVRQVLALNPEEREELYARTELVEDLDLHRTPNDDAEHDLLFQRIAAAESGRVPALSREAAADELKRRLASIGLER